MARPGFTRPQRRCTTLGRQVRLVPMKNSAPPSPSPLTGHFKSDLPGSPGTDKALIDVRAGDVIHVEASEIPGARSKIENMLLVIDIGNTNVVWGIFEDSTLWPIGVWRRIPRLRLMDTACSA